MGTRLLTWDLPKIDRCTYVASSINTIEQPKRGEGGLGFPNFYKFQHLFLKIYITRREL